MVPHRQIRVRECWCVKARTRFLVEASNVQHRHLHHHLRCFRQIAVFGVAVAVVVVVVVIVVIVVVVIVSTLPTFGRMVFAVADRASLTSGPNGQAC